MLLREGIVQLLREAGFEVAVRTGDAEDLLRKGFADGPGRGGGGCPDAAEVQRASLAQCEWSPPR
jgi:hypothetical protein